MLTDQQEQILVGSLLGDGRLECRSQSGTARFRIHHADSQHELVLWKYKHFQELVHRAPWSTDWLDRRSGRSYRSWFFHTETTALFTPMWKRFYRDGRKEIPHDIVLDLTPQALAVWIMDDGCRDDETIILNTQSFTLKEQKLLLKALSERYGIQGTINRDRMNYRLRFAAEPSKKLSRLVRPYIVESLQAKIVPVSTESESSRVRLSVEPIRRVM